MYYGLTCIVFELCTHGHGNVEIAYGFTQTVNHTICIYFVLFYFVEVDK